MRKNISFFAKLFFVLTLCLPNVSIAATTFKPLPDTGQTKCYDTSGNQISCANSGQDGAYQGLQPSLSTHTNYNNTNDTIIKDDNTNLMWTPILDTDNDSTISGTDRKEWQEAVDYCANLTYAGFSDWRLPGPKEVIVSFLKYDTPTSQTYSYWTDQVYAYDSSQAFSVDPTNNSVTIISKTFGQYVRCVRGDKPSLADFIDNSNGTVTDRSTGLIWMQKTGDTDKDGHHDINDRVLWQSALTYCENLDFAGYSDWRVPNIKELATIVDYDASPHPAMYYPIFQTLNALVYFSSTTSINGHDKMYALIPNTADITFQSKSTQYGYVRCVRGGIPGSTNELNITQPTTMTGSGTITSSPTGINCKLSNSPSPIGTCSHDYAIYPDFTSVTLSAVADSGSQFGGWGFDCIQCGTNPTCTITLYENSECMAYFKKSTTTTTYTVTPSVGQGQGTITPSSPQPTESGKTVLFQLSPAPCYHVVNVTGTCGGTLNKSGNTFITDPITKDCTVVANFAPDTYTITASAATGGSISPSGSVSVTCGSDKTFTITPNSGYQIEDLIVDGQSKGALSSYTFTDIHQNHTIQAKFKQSVVTTTYTVTPSVGQGQGSISPDTPQTITKGLQAQFTLTPKSCYHIDTVTGTCGGTLSGNTFTTNPITKDCTVVANFAPDTYTITASAAAGGSISPSGSVSVTCGSDKTFTITPNSGYQIDDLIVDGQSKGALSSYTFTDIHQNHTIQAKFAPLPSDSDNDDITDSEESQVPNAADHNSGDGNADGIEDKTQPHVTSFKHYQNSTYMTLYNEKKGSPNNHYQNFAVKSVPKAQDAPNAIAFPYDMILFKVSGFNEGTTLHLKLFIPKDPRINGYWKKNVQTGGWENIATKIEHAPSYAPNKTVIHFELTDGGSFDEDKLANSVIIDVGGPGISTKSVTVPVLGTKGAALLIFLIGMATLFIQLRSKSHIA